MTLVNVWKSLLVQYSHAVHKCDVDTQCLQCTYTEIENGLHSEVGDILCAYSGVSKFLLGHRAAKAGYTMGRLGKSRMATYEPRNDCKSCSAWR